ncbi:MAG TPA: DUF1566 domain-containing protein [Polyangiaceae bacterium]|nr:DUF1566 domain-containing protein [Polyangiaceae bacterium]
MGVVASLLTATASATAPVGRYTAATDTVRDNRTGLTWRSAPLTATFSRSQASTECGRIGSGWRLPTIAELQSIVDITRTSPAVDTTAFPSTPSAFFWSSSPMLKDTSLGWGVDFSNGSTTFKATTEAARVRCVR